MWDAGNQPRSPAQTALPSVSICRPALIYLQTCLPPSHPPSLLFHTITLISSQPFLSENTPHLPGRDGDIDMPHANVGQRVNDSIGNGLWRSNSWRFAYTFGPNWMMRRWRDRPIRLPIWGLH